MGGISAVGALMSGTALGAVGLTMDSRNKGRRSNILPLIDQTPYSPATKSIVSQEDSALTSQFQNDQMQNTEQAMSYSDQPNRPYVDNPNRLRNIINAFNRMNQNQNQNQNGQ